MSRELRLEIIVGDFFSSPFSHSHAKHFNMRLSKLWRLKFDSFALTIYVNDGTNISARIDWVKNCQHLTRILDVSALTLTLHHLTINHKNLSILDFINYAPIQEVINLEIKYSWRKISLDIENFFGERMFRACEEWCHEVDFWSGQTAELTC